MRIVLALAAFLAFVPTAHADSDSDKDKDKDKQFTHQVELRERYIFEDNQSGNRGMAPDNGNMVQQRLKLAGQYKLSERFSVAATLMNAMTWGSQDLYVFNQVGGPGPFSSGDSAGVHNGLSMNNALMVQEAYGSWLVNDDFLLRFGRGSFTMGDGSVISTNDYDPVPYSFDGVLGTYDMGFGRFSAWAVKFSQYSNWTEAAGLAQGTLFPAYSGSMESDPEADGYGLSFDLQRMPEWLKMVNLHVIDNQKASTPGAFQSFAASADPTSTMGQSILRYGLEAGGAVSIVDYKIDAEGMTGNYNCAGGYALGCNGGGTVTNGNGLFNTPGNVGLSAQAYMAQAEAGVNFHDFMKARVFGRFHYDTGDQSSFNGSSTNVTKIGTYDPYFYDRYNGGGEMEILDWGNLTFYNAGVSVMPTDSTTVKLQYFYYTKSSAGGRVNPGPFGSMVEFTDPNNSQLGQEIDLSGEQKYDGGFSILAHVGMFVPGESIKDGLSTDAFAQAANAQGLLASTSNRSDIFTQVMVQGKFAF